MTAATETAPKTAALGGYRYVVAILLAVVYTFNFMDRQIISTLTEPIRKDLGFSDTQMGMLGGLAFALFYTTFGIPIAWLCDRFQRVRIMAAACSVWSLFTAGCGLANSFVQLALCRVMVGVGEAGGSPPSYSLISDYFAPKERGVGLALYPWACRPAPCWAWPWAPASPPTMAGGRPSSPWACRASHWRF